MNFNLNASWVDVLGEDWQEKYLSGVKDFLYKEIEQGHQIFPKGKDVFNAFNRVDFDKVKVVILGQDPYHDDLQAHGLCFSVPDGIKVPPSLVNIFKELQSDISGYQIPKSGNLEAWAAQGVFLLNATLTVRAHQAGAHQNIGWEDFTNQVIRLLSDQREHLVFLLWGRFAKQKTAFIDTQKHLVLTTAHPSPLSAYNGFFGCKHFSQCNSYLQAHAMEEIKW